MSTVTKPIATDETLQGVAKDTTLQGVAKDTTLQDGLEAIKTAIENSGGGGILADDSDAWSASTSYTAGQTVIDKNFVWECLVNNSNKKPSENAIYWKKITLNSLKEDISGLTIKTLYGTADGNGYTVIPYPDGWNKDNTVILCAEYKDDENWVNVLFSRTEDTYPIIFRLATFANNISVVSKGYINGKYVRVHIIKI